MCYITCAWQCIRPLILYDGKVHLTSRFEGTNDAVLSAVNTTGYMDEKVLTEYVQNEVLPNLSAKKARVVQIFI